MEPGKITGKNTSHSTTLRDYLKIIFKHKIIFLILPFAVLIPLYFSLQLKAPPVYRASVKMFIKAEKESKTDYYTSIRPSSIGEEHSQLVNSNIVIERVVKALKLYQMPIDYEMKFTSRLRSALMKPKIEKFKQSINTMSERQKEDFFFKSAVERLSANVSAEQIKSSRFFYIHVKDFDPTLAQTLANSVSRSYVIFDLEQQIEEMKLKYGEKHATVIQLKNYIKEMELLLDGRIIPDIEAIGPASIKIIEQAKRSSIEAGSDPDMLMIMSFIASMVLSVIFCFTFEIFNQSIKSPKDIETFLEIPFLGSVPERKSKEKLLMGDANSKDTKYTKSFQRLSEKITLLMRDNHLKTLVLTSGGERSAEPSAIIANIAIYLAQKSKYKVLIIDADLINSSLSQILKVQGKSGLSDILQGNALYMDVIQDLGLNLFFLPNGETTSDSVALLGSPMMSNLIKETSEQYDMVLINAPAVSNSADVVILSSITDGIAIVINEGKVRRQVIERDISPLKQKKINIIGAIMNNCKYVIPEIIYKLT